MSTYALILISIVAIPLFLSFYPKIKFYKNIRKAFLSLLIINLLFIAWDIVFTIMGVWRFEDSHVWAFDKAVLPIEEILFFPAVSFSMFFVVLVFKHFYKNQQVGIKREYGYAFSTIFFAISVISYANTYTFVVFLLGFLFTFLSTRFYLEKISKKAFLYTLVISFLPFVIFNHFLVTIPVVTYSEFQILGLRLFNIPIEDFVYSYVLVGAVVLQS